MAKRDHGLLAAAGLTVAEAAKIFVRTRQAIYSGMSAASDDDVKSDDDPKTYFSAHDAMWLLQYAKQTDSDRLDELVKFIATNYPQAETALALQDQVGYEQVCRVLHESDEVLIAFSGNLDELDPASTFAKILIELLGSQKPTRLLLPGEWVTAYIEQRLKLPAPTHEIADELAYLPSFVVMRKGSAVRAFFFQRFAPEECKPNVADGLWAHFSPTSLMNAEGKFRAVS